MVCMHGAAKGPVFCQHTMGFVLHCMAPEQQLLIVLLQHRIPALQLYMLLLCRDRVLRLMFLNDAWGDTAAEVLDPIKESVAIDVRSRGAGALGSPSQSASTSLREKHSMLSQALGTSTSPG